VPPRAVELPGFEKLPAVWLQLTLYHSSLSPHSPGVLVLSISASFGPFHLCLFDLTCHHLLSLATLLVLCCVPAYSVAFVFISSVLPLGPSFPLKSLSFQPAFFFPKNLMSCKAIFAFCSQCLGISVFFSSQKAFIHLLVED